MLELHVNINLFKAQFLGKISSLKYAHKLSVNRCNLKDHNVRCDLAVNCYSKLH